MNIFKRDLTVISKAQLRGKKPNQINSKLLSAFSFIDIIKDLFTIQSRPKSVQILTGSLGFMGGCFALLEQSM